MSYPLEKRNIVIKTLSPVFIGSGEKVDCKQYWIENGELYLCNQKILEEKLNDKSIQEYSNFILQVAGQKHNNVPTNKQVNLSHDFLRKYPDLQKELRAKSQHFILSVKDTSSPIQNQRLGLGATPQTKFTGEVALFMNSPLGFYIPGSSIKGALRQMIIKSMLIKNPKNSLGDNIEDELLRGFGDSKDRMLSDFFRVIEVAVSSLIESNCFQVITVKKASRINESKRKNQPMPIHVLALQEQKEIYTTITINHQLLNQFKQSSNKKLPFTNFDELFSRIEETAIYDLNKMHSNFSVITAKLRVKKDTSDPPNFYLGGHTGFERHTLWNTSSALSRDAKSKLPTTLSIFEKDKNNLYSFGWCRLSMVD